MALLRPRGHFALWSQYTANSKPPNAFTIMVPSPRICPSNTDKLPGEPPCGYNQGYTQGPKCLERGPVVPEAEM